MNGAATTAGAVPGRAHAERTGGTSAPVPEFLLALAITSIAVGIIWDISWHSTIGRDTFWTPAHMAIYFGGSMGGFVGGWLAIKHTFFAGPAERCASVAVFGARAPLGAWVAIWGAVAMITSAPFDNWWHNAYGLDVKIISPPHVLLALGMMGISVGAMLLAVARQNRQPDGPGGAIFVYVGGIFVLLGAVFVTEYSLPNGQHTALFFKVLAADFTWRLVAMSRAGRKSWPATRVALVYMGLECLMVWILPLFPAQPKLAPIFNQVTHMVPPMFPLLLVFPALAIDLVLRRTSERLRLTEVAGLSVVLGVVFVAAFMAVQWFFANFLISHAADNWFFAGNRMWSYGARLGDWRWQFWNAFNSRAAPDPITIQSTVMTLIIASVSAGVGLLWGGWMRRVVR